MDRSHIAVAMISISVSLCICVLTWPAAAASRHLSLDEQPIVVHSGHSAAGAPDPSQDFEAAASQLGLAPYSLAALAAGPQPPAAKSGPARDFGEPPESGWSHSTLRDNHHGPLRSRTSLAGPRRANRAPLVDGAMRSGPELGELSRRNSKLTREHSRPRVRRQVEPAASSPAANARRLVQHALGLVLRRLVGGGQQRDSRQPEVAEPPMRQHANKKIIDSPVDLPASERSQSASRSRANRTSRAWRTWRLDDGEELVELPLVDELAEQDADYIDAEPAESAESTESAGDELDERPALLYSPLELDKQPGLRYRQLAGPNSLAPFASSAISVVDLEPSLTRLAHNKLIVARYKPQLGHALVGRHVGLSTRNRPPTPPVEEPKPTVGAEAVSTDEPLEEPSMYALNTLRNDKYNFSLVQLSPTRQRINPLTAAPPPDLSSTTRKPTTRRPTPSPTLSSTSAAPTSGPTGTPSATPSAPRREPPEAQVVRSQHLQSAESVRLRNQYMALIGKTANATQLEPIAGLTSWSSHSRPAASLDRYNYSPVEEAPVVLSDNHHRQLLRRPPLYTLLGANKYLEEFVNGSRVRPSSKTTTTTLQPPDGDVVAFASKRAGSLLTSDRLDEQDQALLNLLQDNLELTSPMTPTTEPAGLAYHYTLADELNGNLKAGLGKLAADSLDAHLRPSSSSHDDTSRRVSMKKNQATIQSILLAIAARRNATSSSTAAPTAPAAASSTTPAAPQEQQPAETTTTSPPPTSTTMTLDSLDSSNNRSGYYTGQSGGFLSQMGGQGGSRYASVETISANRQKINKPPAHGFSGPPTTTTSSIVVAPPAPATSSTRRPEPQDSGDSQTLVAPPKRLMVNSERLPLGPAYVSGPTEITSDGPLDAQVLTMSRPPRPVIIRRKPRPPPVVRPPNRVVLDQHRGASQATRRPVAIFELLDGQQPTVIRKRPALGSLPEEFQDDVAASSIHWPPGSSLSANKPAMSILVPVRRKDPHLAVSNHIASNQIASEPGEDSAAETTKPPVRVVHMKPFKRRSTTSTTTPSPDYLATDGELMDNSITEQPTFKPPRHSSANSAQLGSGNGGDTHLVSIEQQSDGARPTKQPSSSLVTLLEAASSVAEANSPTTTTAPNSPLTQYPHRQIIVINGMLNGNGPQQGRPNRNKTVAMVHLSSGSENRRTTTGRPHGGSNVESGSMVVLAHASGSNSSQAANRPWYPTLQPTTPASSQQSIGRPSNSSGQSLQAELEAQQLNNELAESASSFNPVTSGGQSSTGQTQQQQLIGMPFMGHGSSLPSANRPSSPSRPGQRPWRVKKKPNGSWDSSPSGLSASYALSSPSNSLQNRPYRPIFTGAGLPNLFSFSTALNVFDNIQLGLARIRTFLISLMVMFLPPLALAASVVNAVSS